MSQGEQFVYTISPGRIKTELESDSEFEVSCRLCNKVFSNSMALQNHARISHTEAYEAGDPTIWSEKTDTKLPVKKIKLAQPMKTNIISTMKPTDVTTLASQNVSYIIFKSDDTPTEKKKRPRKEKEVQKEKKKPELKEPEAITGPFECLEPSNLGEDGSCHQMFFSCCEYSDHQLTEHTRPRRRAARCQVCERPLSQLHQIGTKDFSCEQCSEGFDTVDELLNHKNLFHFQKKRYECSVCQKRFSAQGGVVQHMRMHTGDRPYTCSFCPKAFTQKSGLEQHTRTHTKVKPFVCVLCRKRFVQTVHLRQHMRTHTNVAPFQCVVCDKRFKQSSHLNYHLKNHPANMTEAQQEKYRRIVENMRRDQTETALAEHSIRPQEEEEEERHSIRSQEEEEEERHSIRPEEEEEEEEEEGQPRVITYQLEQ